MNFAFISTGKLFENVRSGAWSVVCVLHGDRERENLPKCYVPPCIFRRKYEDIAFWLNFYGAGKNDGIKRVNHMIMLAMDTLLCECGDNDERFYFALQFPGNITYSLRAAGHCDCFAIHLWISLKQIEFEFQNNRWYGPKTYKYETKNHTLVFPLNEHKQANLHKLPRAKEIRILRLVRPEEKKYRPRKCCHFPVEHTFSHRTLLLIISNMSILNTWWHPIIIDVMQLNYIPICNLLELHFQLLSWWWARYCCVIVNSSHNKHAAAL